MIRKIFPFLFIVPLFGFLTDAGGQESIRQGEKSLCIIGDVIRRVEVHYFEQEKAVPCAVHYFKETEEPGEDQVLWRAEYETGFCEKKMTLFVGRLSSLGWDCVYEDNIPPALRLKN